MSSLPDFRPHRNAMVVIPFRYRADELTHHTRATGPTLYLPPATPTPILRLPAPRIAGLLAAHVPDPIPAPHVPAGTPDSCTFTYDHVGLTRLDPKIRDEALRQLATLADHAVAFLSGMEDKSKLCNAAIAFQRQVQRLPKADPLQTGQASYGAAKHERRAEFALFNGEPPVVGRHASEGRRLARVMFDVASRQCRPESGTYYPGTGPYTYYLHPGHVGDGLIVTRQMPSNRGVLTSRVAYSAAEYKVAKDEIDQEYNRQWGEHLQPRSADEVKTVTGILEPVEPVKPARASDRAQEKIDAMNKERDEAFWTGFKKRAAEVKQ